MAFAVNNDRVRQVEQETLRTFQEEIPSIYFSDKNDAAFQDYIANTLFTYRDLLKLPPKMFASANVIDLGAGTGEVTIAFALWGANCTLVELNGKALSIARDVFARHAPQGGQHKFIEHSIFDYESSDRYDIVQSRGVLAHTADKERAFRRIVRFVRPGGFLIYGDPNKAGGFQNMLQRYAVYRYAKNWNDMERVCETLFKEDIDRSQRFIPRTRRAIIFDRWIIQTQDDPSVAEIMGWCKDLGLRYYSSYPPFLPPLIGDSADHRPRFDFAQVPGIAALAETIWLMQNAGDAENARTLDERYVDYADALAELTAAVANANLGSAIDSHRLVELADRAGHAMAEMAIFRPLQHRFVEFVQEVKEFVRVVESQDLNGVRRYVESCRHLFRGAVGLRHVDFVAFRPD